MFWGKVTTQRTGVVKYDKDHGGYIVKLEESKSQHLHIMLTCDVAITSEIIGNIYENPEYNLKQL